MLTKTKPQNAPQAETTDSSLYWMERALCAQLPTDIFFPSDGAGVIRAQRVCAKCSVSQHCLEYALHIRVDHGVWGGCSERKRRRILKARDAESAA